jgi:hypothetical protein
VKWDIDDLVVYFVGWVLMNGGVDWVMWFVMSGVWVFVDEGPIVRVFWFLCLF